MRLPIEKIKEGMRHPDQNVREDVAYYFARSRSLDSTVMPLVIEALSQRGLDAFSSYTFLENLVQTDETVAWLIREIERSSPGQNERDMAYHDALVAGLCHADPLLLKQQESQIQLMTVLDAPAQKSIADRLWLNTLDPQALLREFIDFCDRQEAKQMTFQKEYEYGCFIVQAMGRYPEQFTEKVLMMLSEVEDLGDCHLWMTVRLAGELRLNAAIPDLLNLLAFSEIWLGEEIFWALAKIGNDLVVEGISERYPEADDELRSSLASILENIHTDLSVQTCLRFLQEEYDLSIRSCLLQSVLMSFSAAGIEPARQFILDTPKSPDVLEVREALLVACKLMGETFPEFEAWVEDTKNDVAFRQDWNREHPLNSSTDDYEDVENEDEGFDEYEELENSEPSVTVVRQEPHVRRNDPCPCGSGKKFKKCCYGKATANEDAEDNSIAKNVLPPSKAPPKFPLGTVALYGPDAKTTTKIVAGVIKEEGADAIVERWVGRNVKNNPKVQRQINDFMKRHGVKSVVSTESNFGCPHEEGADFPTGEDCPFCPYWKGKQGSNRRDE